MDDITSGVAAPSPKVKKWLDELGEARKREKAFRKEGYRIVGLYEGKKAAEYQFNILYSNTETLLPALYNNTPRPVVQRRFKDEDPVGALAAKVTQRTLEYLIDANDQDHSDFDDAMKSATLEALLPGRGVTRIRYEAEVGETTVGEEEVCVEEVSWDRFLHGYAKTWAAVPWIAFEHFMTRAELSENFGRTLGAQVKLTINGGDESTTYTEDGDTADHKPEDSEGVKFAQVFEIWDKLTKKVLFISPGYLQGLVKEVDDPLGLNGFFPVPRPLGFLAKISSLVPGALYLMYEEQAKELNRVTVRINKIISALKVRGFYDSTLEGLDQLMLKDDNTLLPAQNVASMLQGQTLEKAIWLFPIEKLIPVLQQLYIQREQVKQVIYEITGISDILRGSSVASETATAQNIKNQWGTLRLKRMQKEVMRYARGILRIMAELAVNKLSPETLAAMTGMKLPRAIEKQQAQQIAAVLQQQQQPLPPQVQAVLAVPSWEDVLALLQDDLQRNYRIDVETNSTVDAEATEDKENMGEFLNAIAQFMNGIAPMVESGTMPFDAAKSILLAVTRRYRFGTDVEDQIAGMQQPQPQQGPDPAALEKQQQDLTAQQQEIEKQSQALEQQTMQQQADLEMAKKEFALEVKMAKKELAMERTFAMKELELTASLKESSLNLEQQAKDQQFQLKEKASAMSMDLERRASEQEASEAESESEDDSTAPIVETLSAGLQQMGESLKEGLIAAASIQKRAVKGPDGSWTTTVN